MNSAENTVRAYFDAFNRSDVDSIVSVFTEDGTVMADGTPTATGHAQIRSTYQGAFESICFHFECVIDKVLEEGKMAIVRAHATGTITMLSTNSTNTSPQHRELFVLRQADASWKITDYIFNII
jgi:uncharacterized protein (TIGR02246 family)